MRLVVVKTLCLYLLASCKPIARQEEPLSKAEFALAVRSILRSAINPIIGRKTTMPVMAKGLAKQKSYAALSSQFEDIWWQVLDIRKGYVHGVEKEVGGFIDYPNLSEAHQVKMLKNQAQAEYREWAAGVAQGIQKALDANKLYRPNQPDLKTGLKGGYPFYRPETMRDIIDDAKKVLGLLESPLEF